MGDIPMGNMCHKYYLRVSEHSPLIRKINYPEAVAMHTPFVKGRFGLRHPQQTWGQHWVDLGAQVISTYLLSVQWMVTPSGTAHATQAWVPEPPWPCCCCDATHRNKKPCHCIHKIVMWMDRGNLPLLTAGGDLWFLSPCKQSFSKADSELTCNSPK